MFTFFRKKSLNLEWSLNYESAVFFACSSKKMKTLFIHTGPLTENRIWYPRTFTGWIKNNNNKTFSSPFYPFFTPFSLTSRKNLKPPPSVAQLRKIWFTVSSFYLANLRKIFIWHQSNETLTLPNFSCSDKAKTNSVPLFDNSR